MAKQTARIVFKGVNHAPTTYLDGMYDQDTMKFVADAGKDGSNVYVGTSYPIEDAKGNEIETGVKAHSVLGRHIQFKR